MPELNINKTALPDDVLQEIYFLALPTSYPSPVEDNSTSTLITSTPPYNISRVCRSWRNLVLSSPSLWSSFFLSFSNPSDETLKLLVRLIEQHLRRSNELPLTSFVRLEGEYNCSLSQAIAALLSVHQRRWKRVSIWFETGVGNDVIPIPKIQLFVESVALLEELHVSFSTEYIVTSNTGRSLSNSLPALTHLDLHTVCERREAVRWLELAPNLKELYLDYAPIIRATTRCIRHTLHRRTRM